MSEKEVVNEVDGYPTFNEVEDFSLRNYNRGHVIINIIEDMTKQGCTKEECWEQVNRYLGFIDGGELGFIYRGVSVAKEMRLAEPNAYGYNN